MVELWLLGHINSYSELRTLRQSTLRSHVQVKWGDYKLPNSNILKMQFDQVMKFKDSFWNSSIPSMIAGYFSDLENILSKLYTKMKPESKIYLNVANSSYYGVVIETDKILAELASNKGYIVCDIRLARKIKSSSQQSHSVKWLRESVIILQKSSLSEE
jgi:hypothetical protein